MNKDKVYSIYSYNGVDKIYKYNTETKKVTESFVPEDMREDNALNMVAPIVYWKKPVGMSQLDSKPKLIDKHKIINGQECSMIKFGSQREACISNKSGLALYHKFQNVTLYLEDAKQAEIADAVFDNPKE